MALRLEDKKTIVKEVFDTAAKAISAIAADYRGLTVAEITQLRKNARTAGLYLRVVRNTLARRALKETEFACLHEALVGPQILAFSDEEPGAPARVFRDFAKENNKFSVTALAINGRLLSASELDTVANLPSREQALATLLSVMKAPITKFVRTLAEPHAKLVRTIAAVRDQKQAAD